VPWCLGGEIFVPRFLEQLQALWNSFTPRQKVSVVAAAALIAGGLWAFQVWDRERNFRPLYTQMSNEEAGAVVARLRDLAVPYRLDPTGTTVLVPADRLADLRLQLATSGLPKHGRIGFELFDQTKFGSSEFAEHVNYRRALEGELERSVLSLGQVEQARVHISLPKDSVFLDYQQPAKASVIVQVRRRQQLEPEQVRGVSYMVASAVEGLSPDMVAVIDVAGRLLSRPRKPGAESAEELELQQRVERETAQKILHTLEPYLGPDKTRASVSAEVQLNAGEQTEEVIDPNPVMLSTQKSDEQSQPAWAAGAPGTPSNVPRGAGRPSGGGSTLNRKQEITTYQSSKTVTRMKLEKGAVRRLSVAVIVDHKTGLDAAGNRTSTPRAPQEMKTIRDLVVAAGGIIEKRGDLLTVENLPFEGPQPLAVREAAPVRQTPESLLLLLWSKVWGSKYRYLWLGLALGVPIVAFALLIWLRRKTPKVRLPTALPEGALVADAERQLAERERASKDAQDAVMLSLKMPQVTSNKAVVLKKVLAENAKKDVSATVQVMRTWIHEEDN